MFGKQCQSCGMPLKKDPQGGGTEKDGAKSAHYCSYCFVNGRFTNPTQTVEQMQDFVEAKMKELKFPGFLGKIFVRQIPKLKRWQQASQLSKNA